MRLSGIAAALAIAAFIPLASAPAEAQKFPSHLKSCKKSDRFERVNAEYVVPVPGGGAGKVQIVSQNYDCKNSETRNNTSHPLYGMKDPTGKLIVPYAYAKVLPFSTAGAVVIDHGKGPNPKNLMYRTYIAGKGEGKEKFDFQNALMLRPDSGCASDGGAASTGSVSAVIGELFFGLGGGKSHVTLFTPDGRARKLEYMGGDGLTPAVRRVGDVLLARWRDEQGVARSGILDLHGRQIAPVLSNASLWVTPKTGLTTTSVDGCNALSVDLLIEGPSLDADPSHPFLGPLLMLVGRDGQPAAMPEGAVGIFPAYPRKNTSTYSDAPPNTATMWGVVFPKGEGFEFTLHVGAPSEALIAAETGTRYYNLGRIDAYGGLVSAQSVADGKWVTFRSDTDIVVGEANADLNLAAESAKAVLNAEASNRQQALAAAWAKEEARRAEAHKRHWQTARSTGRLCLYRVDSTNTREEIEEYLAACGPGNFAGLAELARAKGVPESTIKVASDNEWKRAMEQTAARAQWEEQARLDRQRNANKDPMASYMPGQWESAIRNAGNAAVDAINQSADNWLQQRRDQYRADWQRSQRAY